MNPGRLWKALVYPLFPSVSRWAHEKRRKGLHYRSCSSDALESQREQDFCFWKLFLQPQKGGKFLEIGGDGAVGSQTLGLELHHGWSGSVSITGAQARNRAREVRKCQVQEELQPFSQTGSLDLLALHQLAECKSIFVMIQEGKIQPRWVIVENREPDPQWCRWLEGRGYKLKFYFHDDKYYEFQG